jgi:hypothetical protein
VLLKKKLSVLWAAAIMMLTVLACSGIALAITSGTVDTQDKYRNVGALVDRAGAYCTGTLVPGEQSENNPTGAPRFLTAAHCAPDRGNTVYVTFDRRYDAERSQFPAGSGVEYKGTIHEDNVTFNDIAVVQLDPNDPDYPALINNVTNKVITPAQLPALGQLADTAKGDRFTAVGYGATSGSSNDYGERRYAVSTFKSVDRTYLRLSQHNGSGGTCYGDSGGPNFLGEYQYDYDKNPDTENIPIIASTTITGDTWCKATNVTLRLDTQSVRGFLSAQGVDVP